MTESMFYYAGIPPPPPPKLVHHTGKAPRIEPTALAVCHELKLRGVFDRKINNVWNALVHGIRNLQFLY